jgi:hypothetical protein
MAMQLWLIRAASDTEIIQEVLIAKSDMMSYEVIDPDLIGSIRMSASSVQPEMLTSLNQLEGKRLVRALRQGEILNQFDLTDESIVEWGEIALRLDPQDAVAFNLEIGECIDLLGIKGSETPLHFRTMTVKNILGQDLTSVVRTNSPPMYLILTGNKKEIMEVCRIKSTYAFQVIKRKQAIQKEG